MFKDSFGAQRMQLSQSEVEILQEFGRKRIRNKIKLGTETFVLVFRNDFEIKNSFMADD